MESDFTDPEEEFAAGECPSTQNSDVSSLWAAPPSNSDEGSLFAAPCDASDADIGSQDDESEAYAAELADDDPDMVADPIVEPVRLPRPRGRPKGRRVDDEQVQRDEGVSMVAVGNDMIMPVGGMAISGTTWRRLRGEKQYGCHSPLLRPFSGALVSATKPNAKVEEDTLDIS